MDRSEKAIDVIVVVVYADFPSRIAPANEPFHALPVRPAADMLLQELLLVAAAAENAAVVAREVYEKVAIVAAEMMDDFEHSQGRGK